MKRLAMMVAIAVLAALWAVEAAAATGKSRVPSKGDTIKQLFLLADTDGDGVFDHWDNCPSVANPAEDVWPADGWGPPEHKQRDTDRDGVGDACDACLDTADGVDVGSDGCEIDACDAGVDADCDGVIDEEDNCPSVPNPKVYPAWDSPPIQIDTDGDGVGDECDACLDTAEGIDVDEDGCELPVEDTQDDSADDASADDEIVDTDGDGTPDSEDVCPDDPTDGCVEEFPVYDLDDSKDAANEDWFAADGGCSLVPAAQPNVMMLIFLVLGFMPLALKRSR